MATMAPTASNLSTTVYAIRKSLNELSLDDVASYFNKEDDDIAPFPVCDGVSVDAFNTYVGDGEGLRVPLRFLELSNDGRILIIDFPTEVHEITAASFEKKFHQATGNDDAIGTKGSMKARRAGLPVKEADATFGPRGSTPNRNAPPPPRTIANWVTLAVEVGRSQSWARLLQAAQWWCGYPGIQYVLLLKVSAPGTQIRYALYDIFVLGTLPNPTARGTFRPSNNPNIRAATVSFDMHRILSIPAHQALPNGVNPVAVVNLRTVMEEVIDTLG